MKLLVYFLQLSFPHVGNDRQKGQNVNNRMMTVPCRIPFTAIKRLTACGILDGDTGGCLLRAHRFIRTVDTILRINEERYLRVIPRS
jgi:hypothetical protein